MPTKDRVCEKKNRESLERVLDLFLSLAFKPFKTQTWNAIESEIRRKKSALKRYSIDDINKAVELELKSLKQALDFDWVKTRGLDDDAKAGRSLLQEIDISRFGKEGEDGPTKEKILLLKSIDSGESTVRAISKCIGYCGPAKSTGASTSGSASLSSYDVSYALRLLQELDLYMPRTDRDEQGATYRHFALDFSSCQPLSKETCEQLFKAQLNKRCPPEASPSTKPRRQPKGKDAALLNKLDSLVQELFPHLKRKFDGDRERAKKLIYVPLQATILPPDWAEGQKTPDPRVPEPSDLAALVRAENSQMLLICEEGGAGKTSLAYEMASWAFANHAKQDGTALFDHPFLPILFDPGSVGDLTAKPSLQQCLVDVLDHLGGPEVSADEVTQLLRYKRLLLIVDHFSELSESQRNWLRQNLPGRAFVLLTARLASYKRMFEESWQVTQIRPRRLQDQELFAFFQEYFLLRRGTEVGVGPNIEIGPEEQLRTRELLERIVGKKPVTVLLAWMVIERAIRHIEARDKDVSQRPAGLLPSSVPDLMKAYVEQICADKRTVEHRPGQSIDPPPSLILASMKALSLAAHCQNNSFSPQNFDQEKAVEALKTIRTVEVHPLAQDSTKLITYLVTNLTLLTRVNPASNPASYRVALDPLADYLAALAQQEIWQRSAEGNDHYQQVRSWLDERLGQKQRVLRDAIHDQELLKGMQGFLAACRDCYLHWLKNPMKTQGESEQLDWQRVLDDFADLAGIDPKEERIQEVNYLIRRYANDLEWNNPELRSKAIAELTAFAREVKALKQPAPGESLRELAIALRPLTLTMAEAAIPVADRAAAAEALGHIGGPEATKALIAMLKNANEPAVDVPRAAAEALGLIDASAADHEEPWSVLEEVLQNKANHLRAETDWDVIDQKLPLLQGASRGLQRLAARASTDRLKVWGAANSLEVPMLTLTIACGAVTTRVVPIEVLQLPLPGGLPLEMVKVPGGTYTIGSPPEEVGRKAYGHRPEAAEVNVEEQRKVTVPSFGMARYPITQVQWRTLAGPEHLPERLLEGRRELQTDPSQHKGGDLPVESVSWHDAREWIWRLNRWLRWLAEQEPARWGEGKPPELTLPSESAWEVACRALTTTPFHFGDTIDAAWANYRGSADYVYPGGRAGGFLQRPSAVGAHGLVNAWGLADLHGNVWEWCADVWHPSPLGGPQDGTPWVQMPEGLLENRLLRGGSWFNEPLNCRSAYRSSFHPGFLNYYVGFRVCCLPPGLPSRSLNP